MKRIMEVEEFADLDEESTYAIINRQSVIWGFPPLSSEIQAVKVTEPAEDTIDRFSIEIPTKRISTGLSGLDMRLRGGVPANSTIVLEVEPNNFTYAFQQQFLDIALAEGNPGIYFCIERSPRKVIESMTRQGIEAERHVRKKLLTFIDFHRIRAREISVWDDDSVIPQVREGVLSIRGGSDKDSIKMALDAVLEYVGTGDDMRIVVESTPYILPEEDALSAARFWEDATKIFSDFNPTVLYTFPIGVDDHLRAIMEGRADGIFCMHPVEMLGMTEVKLEVRKMIHTPKLPRDLYVIEEQNGKINVHILGRIK